MTKQDFQTLTQNVVLLDGATGSNLMAAGMPKGVCTEEWILAHKDVFQALQRGYVEAGSDIIYAPTFGGNRINLTMHHLQDQIKEINTRLVSYSREVADAASRKVYVAADITTSGKMMEPAGDMTYEAAFEMYREQIEILKHEAEMQPLAADLALFLRVGVRRVEERLAVYRDLPLVGDGQEIEAAQQRRLAAAGRADDGDGLALFQ